MHLATNKCINCTFVIHSGKSQNQEIGEVYSALPRPGFPTGSSAVKKSHKELNPEMCDLSADRQAQQLLK